MQFLIYGRNVLYFICGMLILKVETSNYKISSDPNKVRFYLYADSSNQNVAEELVYGNINSVISSRYDNKKNLIIYLSGFLQNYESDQEIKNAYLYMGFATSSNVIIVDWGELSGHGINIPSVPIVSTFSLLPLFVKVVNNVPIVGKRVQEFISFLESQGQLPRGPESIHIVGQSLGAHIAGSAGRNYFIWRRKLIGRITGTDPAGPIFQTFPKSKRLYYSDAKFVDVLHTSQGTLGFFGPLGHLDFFINKGGPLPQPQCRSLEKLMNIFCSHNLAVTFYANSILNPSLRASSCKYSSVFCNANYIQFGEYAPKSARGSYYINL